MAMKSYDTLKANPADNSGQLFNTLRKEHGLKSDKALAIFLDVTAPEISKVRHGRAIMTDRMILRAHERAGIPVARIRRLIAGQETP